MRNIAELTTEHLPPLETVGFWVARLRLVRAALDESARLSQYGSGSSMDPDLPLPYALAERYKGEEYVTDLYYPKMLLHQLWDVIPSRHGRGTKTALRKIDEVCQPESTAILPTDINERMWRIERDGRREALRRVGLLQNLALPIGAVAAYAYSRADITETVDRRLYDNQATVENAAEQYYVSLQKVSATSRSHYAAVADMEYKRDIVMNGVIDSAYGHIWRELSADIARQNARMNNGNP